MALNFSQINQSLGLPQDWLRDNEGTYWASDPFNGNRPVSQEDIDALVQQQRQQVQTNKEALLNSGAVFATDTPTGISTGQLLSDFQTRPDGVPANWMLYSGGANMPNYWGPPEWQAAPHHDNGFYQNNQDFFNPRKNGGFIPIYTALTAGLASGALGAGVGAEAGAGDAALAGGGEVGSGYASSSPGWWGAGDVAGTSGTGALAGNTANDTLAGGGGMDWQVDPNTGDVWMGGSGSSNPFTVDAMDPSLAGGGEVGSGYPSSSPGGGSAPGVDNSIFTKENLINLAKQYGPTVAKELWNAAKRGIPGAVGAVGASRQADAYSGLAQQYLDLGAPSRGRYEASFLPGFTMANDPGFRDALDLTTKSFLHKASINGNPADSPNAWNATLGDVFSQFSYPALQNYRAMNADAGGISRLTAAAPGLGATAINANKGVYDALGGAAADIFNPPTDLATALKTLRSTVTP